MAATSGILSTLISNPFDLITCRLMVQDRSGYKLERALRNRAKYYHGIGDVITKVYRNEGIFWLQFNILATSSSKSRWELLRIDIRGSDSGLLGGTGSSYSLYQL